eukprot:6763707-Prymnesium_polylepis.1
MKFGSPCVGMGSSPSYSAADRTASAKHVVDAWVWKDMRGSSARSRSASRNFVHASVADSSGAAC